MKRDLQQKKHFMIPNFEIQHILLANSIIFSSVILSSKLMQDFARVICQPQYLSFSKKGDLIMFFHVGGICMHNVNNLYQTGPIEEKESIFLCIYATFFLNQLVVTNKSDCHDITEILLKLSLNTITLTHLQLFIYVCISVMFFFCFTNIQDYSQ